MKNLESKIKKKLSEQSMTIQRLATESGVSEPTLHAIFNRGDAKLSQLEKIASALGVTLSFLLDEESQSAQPSVIQTGGFNLSGGGNFQKVKVSKAPSQELAVQLDSCLKEVDHLKEKLMYANQTIASKEETISLLRGTYRNPN